MSKKALLGTGLSGLVGSKFVSLHADKYDFENMDLTNKVNILDLPSIKSFVSKSESEVIVHFAGFTDVTQAFLQTGDKKAPAYQVNVVGTQNIVKVCQEFGKHLIHISTAYVFDGKKNTPYIETDATCPIEWYGQTKTWAEEAVTKGGISYTILRIDRPYRLDSFPRPDILHKVITHLENGTLPPQFTDTSWTPTSIEKFSMILDAVIGLKPQGIYHATTEKTYSDYTFALWVKEKFHLSGEVKEGSLVEYLKASNRPYQRNCALDTTKLQKLLGIKS